jgi:hypothetical protein
VEKLAPQINEQNSITFNRFEQDSPVIKGNKLIDEGTEVKLCDVLSFENLGQGA